MQRITCMYRYMYLQSKSAVLYSSGVCGSYIYGHSVGGNSFCVMHRHQILIQSKTHGSYYSIHACLAISYLLQQLRAARLSVPHSDFIGASCPPHALRLGWVLGFLVSPVLWLSVGGWSRVGATFGGPRIRCVSDP